MSMKYVQNRLLNYNEFAGDEDVYQFDLGGVSRNSKQGVMIQELERWLIPNKDKITIF